jgi:hypothetical protein
MFQLISAVILLVLAILSIFCQTTKQVDGWRHKKLTRYGWIFLVGSCVAFLANAGTAYLTEHQKGKVAGIEINIACANVVHPLGMLGTLDAFQKLGGAKTESEAGIYSVKSTECITALSHATFAGDSQSLLDNGIPKGLFEADLQLKAGKQVMQQTIEEHCKALRSQLSDIIGRYQSVLSSGQVTELLNLRENLVLRSVAEASEISSGKRRRLSDYSINQEMFEEFLHELDDIQNGRFMPF